MSLNKNIEVEISLLQPLRYFSCHSFNYYILSSLTQNFNVQ